MNEYVADTHALYWYLTGSPKLGPNALAAFREGEQGTALIYIPTIVLAELYYLNVKAGLPLVFASEINHLTSAAQFLFAEFRAEHILRFDALTVIPEMHDRIIAGEALSRNCPCLTRDSLIVGSGLVTVVW
jgi:PIN domain nuclease of toxin-antitoxin system